MTGLGAQFDGAVPVREAQGAPVRAVAPLLHAGYSGRGEVAEEVVGAQRRPEGQPQREHPGRGRLPPAGGAGAQFARGEGEDFPYGLVERADGGEPGGEGHVAHRQFGGLDEQPPGLRPLRPGQRLRPRAELGEQLPLDLPRRVPEPRGQPRHPFPVHHPVPDEPHRPRDQVRPLIPLRRPRTGIRPAPLARPEPGLLGGCRAGVEGHVLHFGRHHRAAGPAVDPRGQDGREEPSVEAGVLGLHGPYAAVEVGVHGTSMTAAGAVGSRKSDMGVGGGSAASRIGVGVDQRWGGSVPEWISAGADHCRGGRDGSGQPSRGPARFGEHVTRASDRNCGRPR